MEDDPNYPPSTIITVSTILPVLTVVCVGLRFYVRLKVRPDYLGIDDWMAAAASMLCVGDGVCTILGMI